MAKNKKIDPELAVGIYDPVKDIADKFDNYIKIVVCILLVTMLTMLFMTGALVLDSFHFNSATYKEYSEKIETLNTLQETNRAQLEIIEQNQRAIEELLGGSGQE